MHILVFFFSAKSLAKHLNSILSDEGNGVFLYVRRKRGRNGIRKLACGQQRGKRSAVLRGKYKIIAAILLKIQPAPLGVRYIAQGGGKS